MGILDKLFGKKPNTESDDLKKRAIEGPKTRAMRGPSPAKKKDEPIKLSAKEQATLKNEPYIHIVRMELDPNDVNNGVFELDWNEKFITNLVRAGYSIKPGESENVIVDRWFQTVCRNIALEVYEQEEADPTKRNDVRIIRSRDLGDGRTEVS